MVPREKQDCKLNFGNLSGKRKQASDRGGEMDVSRTRRDRRTARSRDFKLSTVAASRVLSADQERLRTRSVFTVTITVHNR